MTPFTISLCVIAYNEEKYLPDLFSDILAQTYPKDRTQIILIDSMSDDITKNMFLQFKAEHEQDYLAVTVAENPKKWVSAGYNVAIKLATCDIITRIDAHAQIPPEFLANNVRHHEEGEKITGGIRPNIIDEDTAWKRTLLMAESSLFGSSVASYRRNTGKKYVSSIFHGAYRREVFEKVGLYNESLARTEDNEMSRRILDTGYKICLFPDIISYQQTRSSLKTMLKQKYDNGFWVGRTLGIIPRCLSLFHFVPFVFVCGIIAALLLGFVSSVFPILYFSLYALAAVIMTVKAIWDEPKRSAVNLLLPFIFFLLHFSYGCGTAVGLFSLLTHRPTEAEKSFERI